MLSAVTGAIVGLLVAGFEWLTAQQLLEAVFDLPVAVQAGAPVVGLLLCALALRLLARGSGPATADEYIRNFHQPDRRLDLSVVPGRIAGAVVALGLGGALGFEGPSIYLGAATGSALQRRFRRVFGPGAGKVLMVAGAAAGVAAIFKAPATGTVFALEVPYQDDTARRMLLPALVASATGYLVYVTFNGTQPLFTALRAPRAGRSTDPRRVVRRSGPAVLGRRPDREGFPATASRNCKVGCRRRHAARGVLRGPGHHRREPDDRPWLQGHRLAAWLAIADARRRDPRAPGGGHHGDRVGTRSSAAPTATNRTGTIRQHQVV